MKGKLILPDWVICDGYGEPKRNWGVRILDGLIVECNNNQKLKDSYREDVIIEAKGMVLAPGFVNSHTHIYGVLAHGIPLEKAPSGFWPFLEEFWWPLVENRLDHSMICAATELRCADMLKSGVTSFYDCTEAPNALPGCLFSQRESAQKSGMRGILSFEATERINRKNGYLGLKENVEFIQSCRQKGDLISGLMCIHTTFTCSPEFIQEAFGLACDNDVLLHAHVSEGTHEPEFTAKKFNLSPLAFYDSLGVAGPRMLASQCVHLDEHEIQIIGERGIRVSHQPLSNCEVGGGIAPIPQLSSLNIPLGLGSDGYIDNYFEVMRAAFLIHKAYHQDPSIMPANLIWQMATEGGGKALGLDKVGRIAPGWKADIQLINADLPTPLNEHNLLEQMLLYRNPEDVMMVMVDGVVRVENYEVVETDLAQLRSKVRKEASRLWSETASY